jgi:thiamine-monophosphate kinase
MDFKENKTDITNLGEFGLIKHLTKDNKIKHTETIKAVGDDAAVIDTGDKYMLVSTDLLLEGIHFDLTYSPLKHLGYKSIIVNLSDIYAMNGQPKQVTVSIGISNRFGLEAVEELYKGIYLACEQYNVDLVGGDTSSSKQGLIISVTAIGEVSKNKVTYRSGAQPNDLLVVSGDLGGSYMGLQLLEREKSVFSENPEIQPDLGGNDYVLERQLKPEARKDVIEQLEQLKIKPTSMIDISDGLASEVIHICDQSDCGASIYDEKIPIDHTTYQLARDFNLDPSVVALNGGEDYELLFTVPQSDYEKLKDNPYFSIIGHITDKSSGINLIAKNGTSHELSAQGWDAFIRKEKGL